MSHELRTPLNGILGYAQILKQDQGIKQLHHKGKEIEIIEKSGYHLLNLINEILDLSKIEAQKMKLHLSKFSILESLQDIILMVRIDAENKGISVNFEYPQNLPSCIEGDVKRFSQIFFNLLSNAVKFTNKGEVTLRITDLKENEKTKDKKICSLRFEVIDTGVGIPKEKQKEIFSPFVQTGEAKQQMKGTGLGLSISQKLIDLMGGTLQVKSREGEGSNFWFEITFPVVEEVQPEKNKLNPEKNILGYKGKRKKILIVDDRKENIELLKDMLEPLGFETIEAYNGQEGLDKMETDLPDLIITDLIMPVMDGFQFIERIKKSENLKVKDTKIFILTASFDSTSRKKPQKKHFEQLFYKPVQRTPFLKSIGLTLEIEWLYQEENTSLEESQKEINVVSSFELPVIEEIKRIYEAVEDGDFGLLQTYLKNLEKEDSKYLPFIEAIQTPAKRYQEEEILEFLKPYLKD